MAAVKLEDIHYTYDDYKTWDGDWELIDGIPFRRNSSMMAPSPMRKHQGLASEIIRLLGNQLEECEECEVLGEIDYKVNEDTILRPDIVLTCNETGEAYLTKTPNIIVEIISKSSARRDEKYKFDIYESEKVPYYILVYPDDLKAKVYKLKNTRYDKQGDFFKEVYKFDGLEFEIELDFERVFKRYR